MLGSLILYLKGMRIMMFQLSGYYYKYAWTGHEAVPWAPIKPDRITTITRTPGIKIRLQLLE